MGRKPVRALLFTVLASAAAVFAISWALAGRLRRAAFLVTSPEDRPDPEPVGVVSVGLGSIRLETRNDRPDVTHAGIIGLRWDTGYLQAGEVVGVEDGSVTRSIESGSIALEDLTVGGRGPRVQVDPYAFADSPADRGLAYDDVEFVGPIGGLRAWVVPGSESGSWAIHVHGWGATRQEHLRMLTAFNRAGYTSMVIEYRNDPGAPRDASGHYRFGLSEWEDLEAAFQEARSRGAEEVVLMGCSTGGAIILAALERSAELREAARALVLDAPNLSMEEAVRLAAGRNPLLDTVLAIADLRWDIGWKAIDYLERVEDIVALPALVFHGTADQTVPISVSRHFAERLPELVELVETEGAAHVMSWNTDPERYERKIEEFLTRLS